MESVKSLSYVQLPVTPWTTAHPSSVHGILQQEYWSGILLLQGNLPEPGIKPRSPTLQVDSLPSEPPGKSPYI